MTKPLADMTAPWEPLPDGEYKIGATKNEQVEAHYPNGYGASIIRGPYTYGGPEGLWEIAVLEGPKWSLCYDTPITDDVIGWCSAEKVRETLAAIAALAAR